MKKSLLALAALGFVGAASAQSNVTLFGIVDATVAYGSGEVAKKTQLTNSGYNSSRLGVRGVEDLGGGMFAGFWLEAALNNDNGTSGSSSLNNQATGAVAGNTGLIFGRRSTVSLGAKWGEIRLGRDYTPQFWNQTVFDPFGTNGVGTTQTLNSSLGGPTTVRASNSIAYLYGSPFNGNSLGGPGLHVFAQYYMGENADNVANKDDGSGMAVRVGYMAGPLSVAGAWAKTDFLAGDITSWNVAGSYDLGIAQLMGMYTSDEVDGGNKGKGWLLGFTWPLGQHALRGSYSTYDAENAAGASIGQTDKWAVGYVYNLSKRTALYATYAYVDNKDGASQALNGAVTRVNDTSYGLDFGIRHSF